MKKPLFVLVLAVFTLHTASRAALAGEPDLQALIDGTPAGQTLQVPSGTYRGHFSITKPMVLRGARDVILDGGGEGTVLRVTSGGVQIEGVVIEGTGSIIGNGDSDVIAENAPGFVLKNCILRNSLFGIQLLASPNSTLEGNDVSGFIDYPMARRGDPVKVWYSPGVHLLRNKIHDGRDLLVWYSDQSILESNSVERMRYALHYMYSHHSTARHNVFKDSSVGIYNMYGNGADLEDNEVISNRGPSGYGIALKETNHVRLTGNRLIGNRIGLQLDNSPLSPPEKPEDATVFERNRIARNDFGVTFVGSGYGSVFLKNDLVDNWQQVSTSGLQSGTTVWTNNYWSDYRGVDPRRSGVGLIPYSADSVADAITDRFEGFKLFSFGPAILALEFAQKIIPWVQSESKAVDYAPAMQPRLGVVSKSNRLDERLAIGFFSLFILFLSVSLHRRTLV